jgi:hypothetical protein
VSLLCDSEPEANIDENVKESDQVRFIDRNRVIISAFKNFNIYFLP